MEQIKNYVDGMFSQLPQTSSLEEAKREYTHCLEEKYQSLRESGKSEAEALGEVIAQTSSVEDLKKVMDGGDGGDEDERLRQALDRERRRLRWPACIAAAAALLLLDLPSRAVIVQLPLWIVTAVALYLWGRVFDLKKRLRSGGIITHWYEKGAMFQSVLYAGTTALYLLIGFREGLWHPGWLLYIAAAFFSSLESAFRGLNERGSYSGFYPTVYIGAALLYLAAGTLLNVWHPTWMIFILAAFAPALLQNLGRGAGKNR